MQKKLYQGLEKVYEFNKIESDKTLNNDGKKTILKKYNESNLIYGSNQSFYKYQDIKTFDNLSFKSKHSFLVNSLNYLDKFTKVTTQKEKTKEKATNMYDAATDFCNDLLETYFDGYNGFSDAKRKKMDLNMLLLI